MTGQQRLVGAELARPIGPLALAVLGRLQAGPATAAQMAEGLGLPVRAVVVACYKLRVSGRIHVSCGVREGGCWRPIAVYAVAPSPNGNAAQQPHLFAGVD